MTDPKELAWRLRDGMAGADAIFVRVAQQDLRAAADLLDTLARIQSADTDTREIEERNSAAISGVEALDPLAGIVVTRAQRDCATLLDVVRRLMAERDAAIADANECRTLRDQAIRSLEARTKELLRAEDRVAKLEREHGAMVAE